MHTDVIVCLPIPLQPLDAQATLVPDPYSQYELYDRVVNVRDGYSVPLGLRGTVTAIHPGSQCSIDYIILNSDLS